MPHNGEVVCPVEYFEKVLIDQNVVDLLVFLCRHHCLEGGLSYGFLRPVHELAALLLLILRALTILRKQGFNLFECWCHQGALKCCRRFINQVSLKLFTGILNMRAKWYYILLQTNRCKT